MNRRYVDTVIELFLIAKNVQKFRDQAAIDNEIILS